MSELSQYIHFHIGIGWTGVTFGAMAMACRVPDFFGLMGRFPKKVAGAIHILHGVFGFLFLVCCLFMPITANWIWPRYGTPKEIIYLISSMYIAIVLGIGCIRLRRFLSPAAVAVENNDMRQEFEQLPGASPEDGERKNDDSEQHQEEVQGQKSMTTRQVVLVALKYTHGLLMVYSWVMLLGAGQAFLENSRTKGFPYPPGPITDQLIGRCYARDLQFPDMPSWLLNLKCGLGVMCAEKSS